MKKEHIDLSVFPSGSWVFLEFSSNYTFTGKNIYLDISDETDVPSTFTETGSNYVLSNINNRTVVFYADFGEFPYDFENFFPRDYIPSLKFALAGNSYLPIGTHTSVPQDLSEKMSLYNSKIWWEGFVPVGTNISCEASVTGETEQSNELVGTGNGSETTFELDYYPVSRLPITVMVNDIEVESGYVIDGKNIVFSSPVNVDLSVKATYTGVDVPVTWYTVLKGQTIPHITQSSSLVGKHLWTKQTLSTTDSELTPVLYSVSVFINYIEGRR